MKKKIHFFLGYIGSLHQIQGYRGHQNVSKWRPHHSGDICTRENNWKPVLDIWAKMQKNIYFWLFEGPWGYSNFWFCLSCSPVILSSIYMYVWNKEAIWIELLVQIQNIKNIFVIIFGGVLVTSNPGLPNFQGSKTSSYSRLIYNKGKNNQEFFIYGPQCEKIRCFDIGGGGGGWVAAMTGRILLPSYPRT